MRAFRRGRPKSPTITNTEAWILESIGNWAREVGRAQDIYLPKKRKILDLLRFRALIEPLEPGENPDCATDMTELGRRTWMKHYDEKEEQRAELEKVEGDTTGQGSTDTTS